MSDAPKGKQPDLPNVIRDPGGYRELSKPFESFTVANVAINAFFKDVRELRKKYKLPDVYIILKGTAYREDAADDEEAEGDWIISQHHGSSLNCEAMCAWAYGQEAARRQEAISKQMGRGITRREHQK